MTSNTDDMALGMFLDAAERVLSDLCTKDLRDHAEQGEWPIQLWNAFEELGFARATLPSERGGSDFSLSDAMRLIRLAASYAAPGPLAETLVAYWCLAQADLDTPNGPLALGGGDASLEFSKQGTNWVIHGRLTKVAWGEQAKHLVLLMQHGQEVMVALIDRDLYSTQSRPNIAGESRCNIDFGSGIKLIAGCVRPLKTVVTTCEEMSPALVLGALIRAQQMAGALGCVRDLSVRYAAERVQFGKPLNKLPAVQQNLAIIAGHTAAAQVAADMALDALSKTPDDLINAVAMAKVRTGEAAGTVARLAHQVHGAMGFTYEHQLHQFTRRLWAWRDECGNESRWATLLGRRIATLGADQLWGFATRTASL